MSSKGEGGHWVNIVKQVVSERAFCIQFNLKAWCPPKSQNSLILWIQVIFVHVLLACGFYYTFVVICKYLKLNKKWLNKSHSIHVHCTAAYITQWSFRPYFATETKQTPCFKVWPNRFMYYWQFRLSRFLNRFLISMKEAFELITKKLGKLRFQTVWSLKVQYLFTVVLYIFLLL